jgi:glutathione synthase/RimK-type ligase-like ATP-grasp enzyme
MRGGSGSTPFVKRVAYLTGRTYKQIAFAPGEVHPLEAPGRDLVIAAGPAHGLDVEVKFWDEDLSGFDAAVIRSCWNYFEQPDRFITTLEAHERNGVRVFNTPDIVRWNARKTYLNDLGVAAIETLWPDRIDADVVARAFDALGADEIVLKPQVGAGSVDTIRLRRGAWRNADLAAGPKGAAMIQPYLHAIETEGERSLFWFGGAYSHAVRKVPGAGGWLANVPNETRFAAEAPPRAALEVAESARGRVPGALLYVRIDLVLGNDGAWRVIEIEAIEPYLFLDFAPEGADRFAGAIARVLGV